MDNNIIKLNVEIDSTQEYSMKNQFYATFVGKAQFKIKIQLN